MRRFTKLLVVGFMLLVASMVSIAQNSTTGRLSGTVQDPNGAAVPGASVTIRNVETGQERTATTNETGVFTLDVVNPGTYTVSIEGKGFKKSVANGVIVSVSKETQIGISLEVGVASEVVTVSSTQEVINSSSPTLTNVINTRQVIDLPLGGRNPVELAGLQAGIAVVGTDVRGSSIGGTRQTAVNLTQDGINSMDNFVKTSSLFAITAPSLNSTAEFSMTTGTTGSDGARGASQVNIVTKGGTNDFHGGVFYQHINESLNSNNFFSNFNGTARPILRQKFYGFDIGGPVHFIGFGEGKPKHWNGKDKAFFFYSYEAFRQSSGRANNRTVLSAAARQGNFTYTDNAGVVRTVNLLTLSSRGFGLSPFMTAHLSKIPTPNNSTCGGDGFNISCYTFNVTEGNTNDKYVARYDHQLVKNTWLGSHKMEFVVSRVVTRTFPDVFTNGLDAPFPGGVHGFQASTRNLVTPALVSSFGSRITNVLRYGRQWAPVDFNRETQPTAPFIGLSGVTSYDNNFMPQPRNTIVNQINDNLSFVSGNHLLKFGGDWQNVLGVSRNDAGINQQINIGSNSANSTGFALANFTGLTANSAGNTIVGNANSVYANITGLLASANQTLNVQSATSGFVPGFTRERTVQAKDLALYAQDQWRMRNNFTLSFGVRWDYMGVPTIPNGLAIQTRYQDLYGVSGFGNLFKPTAPAGAAPAVATLNFVSGNTGIGLYGNDQDNFAPFVGFAWSPSFKSGPLHFLFGNEGQSSLRGGYSMAFTHDGVTTFTNLLGTGNTNPGLIQTANTSPLSCPTTPCAANFTQTSNLLGVIPANGVVPLNFPTFKMPLTDRENILVSTANGLWVADPHLRSPYIHQYSFGFEREIMKNTALEIRYQGNQSPNLWRAYDINEVNIFESGFLTEFLNAQRNLAARGGTSFAPGCTGCVATPLLDKFFTGLAATSTSGYASTTFISNLNNNNVGSMANTLAFNASYRTARETPSVGIPANLLVANPNAASARVLTNGSKSRYDAVEIEVRRRFSNGLQYQADYTFSKAFVDGDAQGNNQSDLVQPLTLRNGTLDHRRSSQDQTWRFVSNAVYDLPFGSGRNYFTHTNGVVDRLIGGWTMGVIMAYSASTPFTITSGRATVTQFGGDGAQLVGISFEEFKKNLGVFKDPRGVFFVNPNILTITTNAAGKATASSLKAGLMSAPAPGTFGNFPINALKGPNYFNIDVSITKRFRITERVRFEVKTTAINVLNHANFVYGGSSFDSTSFGRITAQRGGVRSVNFIGQLRF